MNAGGGSASAEGEPEVTLRGVHRIFARDGRAAVSDLSLTVQRGEFVVLIGPSGCGKSTTLRMVAGLDAPDRGTVTIAGRSMAGVAPQDRDVAMVFQGYALYPQMTARQIMEFPLRMRKVPAAERARAVDEAAAMLGLAKLMDRRPDQLSGGERQRVAMGRAIVRKPRVFLFDEPLSNIDPSLRSDLRLEIGQLVRRLGATALYVTHDHVEAMTLADRIAVLQAGKLLQIGTAREVYEQPAAEFVGTFVGSPRMNVLPATRADDVVKAGPFTVPLDITLRGAPLALTLGVRPEDVLLGGAADAGFCAGEVTAVEPLGAETHLVVTVGDTALRVRRAGFDPYPRGTRVGVALDPRRVHLFDPARGGARV